MESQILKSSLTLFFFFIILTTFTPSAVASSSSTVRPVKPHIRKACKPTPYPRLCETALSLYASQTKRNQQELCRAAMVSSLKAAQNATSIISKLSRRKMSAYETEVIGDCIDDLKDSVDELRRASTAIKSLSRSKDVDFQVVNIITA
ncbi:21 kDa protein-like [Cucumis melo var. makuwa]|uniref:21 kDa protein-like n=1 Tax=Cucumis melo var. makuwa TaxID=1194695 RepID=A0A5D3DJE3_CUCMM|nr:21 kDa protein-like [Cucumis melo var. makuwa]TYK23682.1 21 kDa protein-like [Cucumis melo var. makuwa]